MASPQTRPIAPYQQPSLPSIRQLHPYLPPSGMAQHLPPSDPSTYTYPLPSPYSGPSGSSEIQQLPSQHALYGRSEMIDSEPEGEIEQQGPAKKKRRRQALSCNECKRRKIKCDRAQPCGPCTRRGEQSKCQWRTLEPVDKYVTRTEYEELKNRSKAEYDELKSRLDHLESVVARLFPPPAGPANVPMYSIPADISGASSSDNVTSYHSAHSSAGQALYVASSSSFTQDPGKSQSYAGSSSPHIAGSGISHGPSIPSSSSNTQSVAQSAGPSHLRHPSDAKSPTIVRQSPLSLASITSPYNADTQPKNFHAQTFRILGERLRPVRKSWKGPVELLCGILKRWNMLRCPAQQALQWKARQCHQGHTIYRHRDVMVILP
ncbi:uncharacterized protein F5891DRAFT_233052 [Suillus fuscotomentosus]|uniref:Zn(2)-C6 fungal-type domain-containing protein n=1 Tax=Suillus fuscotomentosus TaxID=1912939 RepID=A0AAD4EBB1_9AGAM|nr:uncharacterized protein F5891DRAFT_233052 [Suillus fuscotomentosus]KAG1901834.1 hypothetical protein F5891DRAFT_233052 [Suillus fuscotomentosus]